MIHFLCWLGNITQELENIYFFSCFACTKGKEYLRIYTVTETIYFFNSGKIKTRTNILAENPQRPVPHPPGIFQLKCPSFCLFFSSHSKNLPKTSVLKSFKNFDVCCYDIFFSNKNLFETCWQINGLHSTSLEENPPRAIENSTAKMLKKSLI